MNAQAGPILHVAGAPEPGRGGPAAGELVYAAAAGSLGPGDRVLIVGGSGDRDAACALGIEQPMLVSRRARPLSRVIRRAASVVGAGRVRLWNRGLLRVAPGVTGRFPVEACLYNLPPGGEADPGRVRAGRLAELDRLIVPDEHAASAWRGAGAAGAEVQPVPAVLPADRGAARERLGLEGSIVLMPLSADPPGVDARAIVFVSGVLELLGLAHAVVLPRGCKRWVEAVRFRRRTGLRCPLVLAGAPFVSALPAADVFIAPVWAGASPVRSALEAYADRLGAPVASIAGWETAAGLAGGMRAPDLRANMGPLLEAYRAVAGGGRVSA